MEKFRVNFEMTNGENHFYMIESESVEAIYELINSSTDGWVKVHEKKEKHFIKTDKITRVKVISEDDFKNREKKQQQEMVNAFKSWNN
jgi:hypothetical protein